MFCRSRNLIEENESYRKFKTNFLYENLDTKTIKTYDDIKSHFRDFRIDEEFNTFLTDDAHQSFSDLRFTLCQNANIWEQNENNLNYVYLFVITIEVTDNIPDYTYYFREVDFDDFNNFLSINENLEHFNITIIMETKFYLQTQLFLDLREYTTEEDVSSNEEELEIIPIIEKAFKTKECCICLTNKPNILNIPCLHLTICEKCEETGKFKKCINCRKRIYRKAKI